LGERTIEQGRSKQILIRLADHGAMTTSALAGEFDVKTQAVSQYLRILREAKLVNSERRVRDKRFWEHSLTSLGRQFLDSLYDRYGNAPETRLWTSEEIEKELGRPVVEDAISHKDWKEQRDNEELARKARERIEENKRAEREAANNVKLAETEDGAIGF